MAVGPLGVAVGGLPAETFVFDRNDMDATSKTRIAMVLNFGEIFTVKLLGLRLFLF